MPELKNMTVEDRLAEKLKTAEFAQWFGEDDLRELVGKALDLAFFKDRRNLDRYGNFVGSLPPAIVEVAATAVREKVDQLVLAALRERLAAEPEILADIVAKMAERSVEDLILAALMRAFTSALSLQDFNIQNRIREMLQQGTR